MKPPYQLVFQGMPHSDALEAAAARHAIRLDRLRQDITRCKIHVVLDEKHKQQGKPFNIHVEVTIPGHELVSSKEHDEDVYIALRKTFDNVTRMLKAKARKQHDRGKRQGERTASATVPPTPDVSE